MKSAITKIVGLSILGVVLLNCTSGFEEINTNPAAPVDVQPEFLFRKVLYDYLDDMSYEGFVAGNLLGQHFTAIDFNLFDRHSLSEPQYGGNPWPFLYENLRDNEIILQKADDNALYEVYKGPALIYKAYLTAVLTDLYGDVPYSEAIRGKAGNLTPAYNTQEEIYLGKGGIIDNLETAIGIIDNYRGTATLKGDIIYDGDLGNWRKLANSLLLKYYLRISSKVVVSEKLRILLDRNDFLTKDAVFRFTQNRPNNFRMANARIGDFQLFIMSKTAEESYKKRQDPRMAVFYRPTANDNSLYRGLLNGPDASQLTISGNDYSLTGKIFRENAGALKAALMTQFETDFLLAEAAVKGYIAGNAKTFYDRGVKAAFAYWDTPLPADYLTATETAYDPNRAMEQIISEKWVANCIHGYEGWIEWRRTGFPKLKTISGSLNNNLIPVRMPYPSSEATLNSVHYREAAAKTANNSINVKVWWNQ